MVSKDKVITVGISITVIFIIIAILIPIPISSFNDDSTTQLNQTDSVEYEITTDLISNATIDNSTSTVTVNLTADTGSTTESINEGENATLSVNSEDIITEIVEINNDNSADIKYSYPTDFGWGSSPSTLYYLMPLFIILVPLMFIVGLAQSRGYI